MDYYGIIKSISSRDKLYVKLKSTPKDNPDHKVLEINLKSYNRIIKKLIREAQTQYFSEKLERYKNDIKNTWKTINEVLYMGKKAKKKICKLIIDEKPITDTKQICTEFNNFFTNIGPKLAKEIPTPANTTVEMFLKRQIASSFKFELTNIEQNLKLLMYLRPKPSAGYDGISVILLKFLSPALIPALTLMINQSLVTGIFPAKLKVAKVIPLFKKDDDSIVDNYRPVSLLPSISKLFEKWHLTNYMRIFIPINYFT